jgi:hypothetical protein
MTDPGEQTRGSRKRTAEQPGFFDKPSAKVYTPPERERDIERLVPLAQEIAKKAGCIGITVSDLRLYAVHRGILTGEEEGRRLSFLGAVMPKAGLTATARFRRSDVDRAHGNLNVVWVLE